MPSKSRTASKRADAPKAREGRAQSFTTADLVVLSLIAERSMHGYELVKEYERQNVKDWASVSRAHVYYALRKLREQALIAEDESQQSQGLRPKAIYRITKQGLRAMREELASNNWATSRTPSLFNTWLGLSIHARKIDQERIILARREFLKNQVFVERQTLVEIDADNNPRAKVAHAMVSLAIEQFELELQWLGHIEATLTGRQ